MLGVRVHLAKRDNHNFYVFSHLLSFKVFKTLPRAYMYCTALRDALPPDGHSDAQMDYNTSCEVCLA